MLRKYLFYSNGEMTNYFYHGINLSNNALVKVGYTLEQSQPASLALYKMAEGDEWTGDEVELVPGDTTDPEPFLADFVGYLYGTRVLDNIDNPDEECRGSYRPPTLQGRLDVYYL